MLPTSRVHDGPIYAEGQAMLLKQSGTFYDVKALNLRMRRSFSTPPDRLGHRRSLIPLPYEASPAACRGTTCPYWKKNMCRFDADTCKLCHHHHPHAGKRTWKQIDALSLKQLVELVYQRGVELLSTCPGGQRLPVPLATSIGQMRLFSESMTDLERVCDVPHFGEDSSSEIWLPSFLHILESDKWSICDLLLLLRDTGRKKLHDAAHRADDARAKRHIEEQRDLFVQLIDALCGVQLRGQEPTAYSEAFARERLMVLCARTGFSILFTCTSTLANIQPTSLHVSSRGQRSSAELQFVQNTFPGATFRPATSIEELRKDLRNVSVWYVSGEMEGNDAIVLPDHLKQIIADDVQDMCLAIFNGCNTLPFAQHLINIGVPVCVGWRGHVEDSIASRFGIAMLSRLLSANVQEAFRASEALVRGETNGSPYLLERTVHAASVDLNETPPRICLRHMLDQLSVVQHVFDSDALEACEEVESSDDGFVLIGSDDSEGEDDSSPMLEHWVRRVQAWYALMLGTQAIKVPSERLTLGELSDLRVTMAIEQCVTQGLVPPLLAEFTDLLVRRSGLHGVLEQIQLLATDLQEDLEHEDDSEVISILTGVSTFLLQLTEPELLIAMLELSTTPAVLVRLAAKLDLPLPFMFPNRQGQVGIKWPWFSEILSYDSHPLMLNLGTSRTKGKTTVLSAIIDRLAPTEPGRLGKSIRMCGVDLYIDLSEEQTRRRTIMDFHGADVRQGAMQTFVRVAASAASVILLHVGHDEILDEGSNVSGELQSVLEMLEGHGKVLVVWRDVRTSESGPKLKRALATIELILGSERTYEWSDSCCLRDFSSSGLQGNHRRRAEIQQQSQLQRLKERIDKAWDESDKIPLPSLDVLRESFRVFEASLVGAASVRPFQENPVSIWKEVVTHLDSFLNAPLEDIERVVYPLTTIGDEQAGLRQIEKRLRMTRITMSSAHSPDNDPLMELDAVERRVHEAQRQRSLCKPSHVMILFLRVCHQIIQEFKRAGGNDGEHRSLLMNFERALCAWKEPHMAPLRAQLRELDREVASCMNSLPRGDAQRGQERDLLIRRMESINLSLERCWAEALQLVEAVDQHGAHSHIPEECGYDMDHVLATFCHEMASGQPFQILRGTPLQFASGMLHQVFARLPPNLQQRKLLVVSVIGLEGSAKSTLMNVLFNCGLSVCAGKCTRGIYGTLTTASFEGESYLLLVLDSEGLLSLQGGDDVFDKQIALISLSCSHLVIVNHRGDLGRQLRDMLEICLYAMKHLQIIRAPPKILFVLRDQVIRTTLAHRDSMCLMLKNLQAAADFVQAPLGNFMNLSPEDICLLPCAYKDTQGRAYIAHTPSVEFAQSVLLLRQQIFKSVSHDPFEFGGLVPWLRHFQATWDTLHRFGTDLLHYKTIEEITQRKELERILHTCIRENIFAKFAQAADERISDQRKLLDRPVLGGAGNSKQVDDDCRQALKDLHAEMQVSVALDFEQRCQTLAYGKTLVEEYKPQLRHALDISIKQHLKTWDRVYAKYVNLSGIDCLYADFDKRLNTFSSLQISSAPEELSKLFEQFWEEFVKTQVERLKQDAPDAHAIRRRVSTVFTTVFSKLRLERGIVLNEECLRDAEPKLRQRREIASHCPFSRPHVEEIALRPELVIHFLTSIQEKCCQLTDCLLKDTNAFGCMPSEEQIHNSIVELDVFVKTMSEAHLLNELDLRRESTRILWKRITTNAEEDAQHDFNSNMQVLMAQKISLRTYFLTILDQKKGDLERAQILAPRIVNSLKRWVNLNVEQLVGQIRSDVQKDMPSVEQAWMQTFDRAFGAEHDPMRALMYSLDPNTCVRSTFSDMFNRQQDSRIADQYPRLRNQITALFVRLDQIVDEWASHFGNRESNFEMFRQAVMDADTLRDDKAAHTVSKELQSCFPEMADFKIADASVFAVHLKYELTKHVPKNYFSDDLPEEIRATAGDRQRELWEIIKGCPAVCPCCGSRCAVEGDHKTHKCAKHLLPAFNGTQRWKHHTPVLEPCLSGAIQNSSWRVGKCAKQYSSMQKWYQAEHPDWLPIPPPSPADAEPRMELKRGWVQCRKPLIAYYSQRQCNCCSPARPRLDVDNTPAGWIDLYDNAHCLDADAHIEACAQLKSLRANCMGCTVRPHFSKISGEYVRPVILELTSATPGAQVYYKIADEDSVPWSEYEQPLVLENEGTITITAKAVKIGLEESGARKEIFNITSPVNFNNPDSVVFIERSAATSWDVFQEIVAEHTGVRPDDQWVVVNNCLLSERWKDPPQTGSLCVRVKVRGEGLQCAMSFQALFSDTVQVLVNQIRKRRPDLPKNMELAISSTGAERLPPRAALKECGIKSNSTLFFREPGSERTDMSVSVFLHTRETILIQVNPNETIAGVKDAIQKLTSPASFDLIAFGKVLEDDRTLSDYNIQKSSTLSQVRVVEKQERCVFSEIPEDSSITMVCKTELDHRMWEIKPCSKDEKRGIELRKQLQTIDQGKDEVIADLAHTYNTDRKTLVYLWRSLMVKATPGSLTSEPAEEPSPNSSQGTSLSTSKVASQYPTSSRGPPFNDATALQELPHNLATHRALSGTLAGAKVRECGGAGWCQFLSIAQGILALTPPPAWWDARPIFRNVNRSVEDLAKRLRDAACNHIEENASEFECWYAMDGICQPFQSWLLALRGDGWGDQLTLKAICEEAKVNVRVFNHRWETGEITLFPAGFEDDHLVELLYIPNNHYKLIVRPPISALE